ncbi:MAG: hypothetical protein O2783_05825 [Chloroflexi bacterium]|nr:hypothetical protein [Chloroflexota bacterium]
MPCAKKIVRVSFHLLPYLRRLLEAKLLIRLTRPDVLEKIQEVVWSGAVPKRTASVHVYDLAEAS